MMTRDSLIVRFQNISDTPVTYYAGLSLANVDVKGVYITDLNEQRIEKLSVSDEKTEFCIKPKSLFTLEMVIGNGESE